MNRAAVRRRRYVTLGIIMGLATSVVAVRLFGFEDDSAITAMLGGILATIGGLVGLLLAILSDDTPVDDAPGPVPAMPDAVVSRESSSSTIRIVAVSADASTADLRADGASPLSPRYASAPDVDINVLIEGLRLCGASTGAGRSFSRSSRRRSCRRVPTRKYRSSARRPRAIRVFELVGFSFPKGPLLSDGRCPGGLVVLLCRWPHRLGMLGDRDAARDYAPVQHNRDLLPTRSPAIGPVVATVMEIFAGARARGGGVATKCRVSQTKSWPTLGHGQLIADIDVDGRAIRNLAHVRSILETGVRVGA